MDFYYDYNNQGYSFVYANLEACTKKHFPKISEKSFKKNILDTYLCLPLDFKRDILKGNEIVNLPIIQLNFCDKVDNPKCVDLKSYA
jgi:hypothetical protein